MRPTGKLQIYFLTAGLCAAPVSIAVSEILLGAALILRLAAFVRGQAKVWLPHSFRAWLAFAALLMVYCVISPAPRLGAGELRHLGLIAALFLMLPALDTAASRVTVWRGILLTATVSSLALAARFAYKLRFHDSGVDPIVYLRGGGLLHHWMVYATVEIVVVGGLLEFWRAYPNQRRWVAIAASINALAIVLSLTRMLWVCSFVLLAAHLIWRRSRWSWALPALPLALYLLAPGPIRIRVTESFQSDYYSNAERLQMLRVGSRMVRDKPLTGVGPGRVEQLYPGYLKPGESLPAYHGHLHNNLAEIAAQSGVPTLAAAVAFIAFLFRDLLLRLARASDRDTQFLCRAGILGLAGFLAAGMVDYTYGHSVGLIVCCFAALAPLAPVSPAPRQPASATSDRARVPQSVKCPVA